MMKKITVLCLGLFVVCLSAAVAVPSPYLPKIPRRVSVVSGKSIVLDARTHVVAPKSLGPNVAFAARELSTYLGQALSCDIPVVESVRPEGVAICLGASQHAAALGVDIAAMDRDGFAIRTGERMIVIAGQDSRNIDPVRYEHQRDYQRSTLFGVYDFLERMVGVRFYFPGEFGVVVPKTDRIELGSIDIYDRPDHHQRRTYEVGGAWYEEAPAHKGMYQDLRNRYQTFYIPCCHSLEQMGLYRRFIDKHPEYFAVKEDGKPYGPGEWSIGAGCYLSEGYRNEVTLDAISYLKGEGPEVRGVLSGNDRNPMPGFRWGTAVGQPGFFSIMPGDHHRRCLCPKCKEYLAKHGENEYVWDLVCDIAERVKKSGVPGRITAMSYAGYTLPPKRNLPDNLDVMVAINGPWADRDPKMAAAHDKRIRLWTERLGHRVWLWTYPGKLGDHCTLCNFGIPQMAPRTVGNYYKRQAPYTFGAFYEGETDQWIFNYLNTYVFYRVCWNNDTDVEALVAEHHSKMFGPAAKLLGSFYDDLETIWTGRILGKIEETHLGPVNTPPDPREIWEAIYTKERLANYDKLFDDALALCDRLPGEKGRIQFIRSHFLDSLKKASAQYFKEKDALADWNFVVTRLQRNESIAVDGKLDDSGWTKANFIELLPVNGKERVVHTRVYGRIDDASVYFGLECMEPHMDKTVLRCVNRDDPNAWQDADVEIMLNPAGDGKRYYQYIINSKGVVADYRNERKGSNSLIDVAWNSRATVAAQRLDDRFIVEIAIPKDELEGLNPKGMKANFCRHRALNPPVKDNYYSWSANQAAFHEVEKYGRILFEDDGRNQITNCDFTKPFQMTWTPSSYDLSKPSKVSIVADDFITCGSSAQLTSDGAFVWLHHSLKLKADTVYAISFFLKMDKVKALRPGGGFRILLADNTGTRLPQNPYTGSLPWTRQGYFWTTGHDADVVLPGRCHCIRFDLREATGTVWIDNVQVVEMGPKGTEKP